LRLATFRLLFTGTALLATALIASTVNAQTSVAPDLTPPPLDLQKFLEQSKALHDNNPQAPGSLTAQGSGSVTNIAAAATAEMRRPLPRASAEAIDRVLTLTSGSIDDAAVSRGLAAGNARVPAIPTMQSLDRATARAVVEAFQTPGGLTAYDKAQIAAAGAVDAELEERIALVRTIYRVDGTDALIRHFVSTQHMRLIITEVNNHVNIAGLSEPEKYRLAAIAAAAQTELEDKVLDMDARLQAKSLSKPELMQLIGAFDSDAQRKLTELKLKDDGKLDRGIELDIAMAQIQILRKFESGQ
jgi:hypothetical protein